MQNGSRWKALALLVAMFVAGAAAGWFSHERIDDSHRAKRHGRGAMIERLTRELDLSAAQQDSVGVALEDGRRDIDSLWADVHPRFEEIRGKTDARIETQLTADQRAHYVQYKEKHERRRERREGGKQPL